MPRRRLCLAGFYLDMFAILEFGIFICLFVYLNLLGSVDFLLCTLGSDSHSAVLSRLHLYSHDQRREPSSIPRAIFRIPLSGSRAARQLPARLELFNVGS